MNENEKILISNICKNIETTMIGSLARFESTFGYLWENDNANADRFGEMWDYVRNSILNNGNKQIRNTVNELNKHFNKNTTSIKSRAVYKFNNTEEQ